MDTFLPPIERPEGLIKKLAYYFTRRHFGKVLTPVKVHSARLPAAFGLCYSKIGKLDKKLTLSPEMVLLIREQVARIQYLPFLLRYWPLVHYQSVHEPGEIRRPGTIPPEQLVYGG